MNFMMLLNQHKNWSTKQEIERKKKTEKYPSERCHKGYVVYWVNTKWSPRKTQILPEMVRTTPVHTPYDGSVSTSRLSSYTMINCLYTVHLLSKLNFINIAVHALPMMLHNELLYSSWIWIHRLRYACSESFVVCNFSTAALL